jgi:exopolysaccharide biosynthesis polyprenyl glycosylphosphotransferase
MTGSANLGKTMRAILQKKLILLLGDAVLIAAAFYLAPALRFGAFLDIAAILEPIDLASVFSYLLIFYIFDLYTFEERFWGGAFTVRFGAALVAANVFIMAMFFLLRIPLYSLGIVLLSSALIFVFCLTWRIIFESRALRTRRPLRLAVLGAGGAGQAFYDAFRANRGMDIVLYLDDDPAKWGKAVGSVSIAGGSEKLTELVREKKIDKVIVAITHGMRPEVYSQLIGVKFSGVNVYELPTFWEMKTGKIPVDHVSDVWLIHSAMSGVRRNMYAQRVKRVIDIALSLAMLLAALLPMVLIGVAIRLDSPGPALFFQRRTGWQGRPFGLYKFRTMHTGMEMERASAGRRDDPRITRVGRVLRSCRFDELPQLWNVLKGEMSFIGPRALMEQEVREFEPEIPYFGLRHAIRPGITGWAQVNYPHGATKEDALEKLQYDLYYLKNMSFLLDLHILVRTVRVVLFGKGAR